ncbi:hypothetical protein Q5738_01880 [Citrobacter werkmanii]|nr:hypothetical protein [Citrobacter werkmanii]MDO8232334.1 hypothetical protein [Citrobacter werkmanii]
MPEIRKTVIGWNGYGVRQCVYTRNDYAKTPKGREPRFEICNWDMARSNSLDAIT